MLGGPGTLFSELPWLEKSYLIHEAFSSLKNETKNQNWILIFKKKYLFSTNIATLWCVVLNGWSRVHEWSTIYKKSSPFSCFILQKKISLENISVVVFVLISKTSKITETQFENRTSHRMVATIYVAIDLRKSHNSHKPKSEEKTTTTTTTKKRN